MLTTTRICRVPVAEMTQGHAELLRICITVTVSRNCHLLTNIQFHIQNLPVYLCIGERLEVRLFVNVCHFSPHSADHFTQFADRSIRIGLLHLRPHLQPQNHSRICIEGWCKPSTGRGQQNISNTQIVQVSAAIADVLITK